MLNALEAKPAIEPAPRTPHLRVEPRPAKRDVVPLMVAAWTGKKRFCEAVVIERGPDSMSILAAAPLEQGEQVWFTENDAASGMFVHEIIQQGAGFRLDLHREKRRSPRFRVDEPGELEWPRDHRPGRANVMVLDVSAGGLRLRSKDPIPEEGEVRVKFAGMVRDGEIRYCLPLGGAAVAGIEFL